jgi:polyhydroxybutyrate depolymerase
MITVGGRERTFLVHAPASYTGTTPVPVVLDFHGLSGSSMQQKNLSRWDRLADSRGFLAVYPQGVGSSWNAGRCCGDSMSQSVDDVAFVRAIIMALQADACIDAKRVYTSGCSNGGGMSFRVACEAADVVAGVAPVDFDCVTGGTGACGNCAPARPFTIVQFRGTNDQLVPYTGSGAFAGAQANFTRMGQINMCTGAAEAVPQRMGCETFPMCGAGVETILCTVQNGSHCGSYQSFMIPDVAWEVFQRQALP